MGREIDLTQPLSAEDRKWLEERGKHGDLRVANELHPQSGAAVADPDEDDSEVDQEALYGTWTKAQLQYELQTRDLPTTGTKAELVDRLVEADGESDTGDLDDDEDDDQS